MAQVYYISSEHTFHLPHPIHASSSRHLAALAPLIKALFKKGSGEQDCNCATVVVLHSAETEAVPASTTRSQTSTAFTELDTLSYEDKVLLLRYFFSHLNLIVASTNDLVSEQAVRELNTVIDKIGVLARTRISRVATWTGTGINLNDYYSQTDSMVSSTHLKICDVVNTMSFAVGRHANLSQVTEQHIIRLKNVVLRSIDFFSLLSDLSNHKMRTLCHLVGHWAFPAHELSNDDLAYSVYLMLGYALSFVKTTGAPDSLEILTANELLAFVFMSRDTYKNGNPFHNFRHAADVLQATFFFLLKLRCLPEFEQYESDPRANELDYLEGKNPICTSVELVAKPIPATAASDPFTPLLNPLQSLALLVAALGHDVGHPGVTNAFMVKHSAPTSQLFGERSVLESFHVSVFTNKILSINWPSLSTTETEEGSGLYLKQLIINSILATDMAEHFEYIHKLKAFQPESVDKSNDKVKLVCSLLIKCADISNVTKPIRVSSQWASVLSREFNEIETLEKALDQHADEFGDVSYEVVPSSLDDILAANPQLHKGQIFFIDAFAEGLFKSILEYFPELAFTWDIIHDNIQFWLERAESLGASS